MEQWGIREGTVEVRECGDVTANHPRGGVFNVTSRVTLCGRARKIAIRWFFRGERTPNGYACRRSACR